MPRQSNPPVAGSRIGRWTVIGPPEWLTDKYQRRMLLPCRCECGTERLVRVVVLQQNRSENLSCGCWRRERTAAISSETRWKDSHGRASGDKDPLYVLWLRINRRCHDVSADNYRYYGARGIKVHDEWRHDPGAFIAYIERELGPRPDGKTPGGAWIYSLDRINNDGNYEPGNLRWATHSQQVRNRRAARLKSRTR